MKVTNVTINNSGLTLIIQDMSKLGSYKVYYNSDLIQEITPTDESFELFIPIEKKGVTIYIKSSTFTNLIVMEFKYIDILNPKIINPIINFKLDSSLSMMTYPVQMISSSIDTVLAKPNVLLNTEFLDNYNRGFNEGFILGQLL